MSQEVLHQHESEQAQQLEEAAARFDNGSLSNQDIQMHVGERSQPQGHRIEIKEGHACSADCPDHNDHGHHHERRHNHEVDRKHTIAQKPAEHACGADCPEHSTAHGHEGPHTHHVHNHEGQPQDHRIERKIHMCGADCPDHNHQSEDVHAHKDHNEHHSHPEIYPHHDHHIEHKPHACGADCPEHGAHTHNHAEAEQQEPGQEEMLAYQKATEAVRESQHAEARGQAIEREMSAGDVELVQERIAEEKVGAIEAVLEAGQYAIQNAPQAPEQQPERQEFVADPPVASGAVVTPAASVEAPAELPFVLDAVETAEVRPEVETRHEVIDQNIELAADMHLPAVEIVSFDDETPVIPIIEQMQSFDAQELNDEATLVEYSEMLGEVDVAGIDAVEPLEDIGTARMELPMPDPVPIEQTPEAYESTEEIELPDDAPTVVFVDAPNQPKAEQGQLDSAQAAGGLAELVSQRIEATAEHVAADAPLRAQAIRKTLHALTELQTAPDSERSAEASQQQLLRLLQLLGYENPSQTLRAYVHQYGADFVSELEAKLFEMLSQGRVYESLSAASLSFTVPLTSNTSALGMVVLALAQLRGHMSAVARGI